MGHFRTGPIVAGFVACVIAWSAGGCTNRDAGGTQFPDYPPPSLDQAVTAGDTLPQPTATPPPPTEREVVKKLLIDTATRHGVNPALVLGLAWWESGWNQSAVSLAGAIGVMQVMPATAAVAGPLLLHRNADVHDLVDNIDLGTAILRSNLDRFHGDLVGALVDYYAGPSAVTDWSHLDADKRHYVWGVYRLAVAFQQGRGPA